MNETEKVARLRADLDRLDRQPENRLARRARKSILRRLHRLGYEQKPESLPMPGDTATETVHP